MKSHSAVTSLRILLPVLIVFLALPAAAQDGQTINDARFPNILGYRTLKCDFHMHTVFSDGRVWPTVRVLEARREGLDAIAITDHIEYRPFKDDVVSDHNRSFAIAREEGDKSGVLIIPGVEITRAIPPGHFNAIFVQDANALDREDFLEVLETAKAQGAFLFYNHPAWRQPDGKSLWAPIHDTAYEKGLMMGIEVANGASAYTDAFGWALEKNLTVLGNSDSHWPMDWQCDIRNGEHRTMTLVFAKERSLDAIHDALIARRTVAWIDDDLYGEEQYLSALFAGSVELRNLPESIEGRGLLEVGNTGSQDLVLEAAGDSPLMESPATLTVPAGGSVLLRVKAKDEELAGKTKVKLPYRVTNMHTGENEVLEIELAFTTRFVPAAKTK